MTDSTGNAPSAVGYELRGPAAWLRLQRPEKMNAINPELVQQLRDGLDRALSDGARAVVITGTGGVFCAGADLEYVLGNLTEPGAVDALLKSAGALMRVIERYPAPVIAAVNGVALAGGFELVLTCDLVIASDTAMLGDGHAKFGLFPGAGGAVRLPRLVGPNRAKALLFTGDTVGAAELRELGVVNTVVAGDELEATVQKLCERIGRTSAAATARLKRVVDESLDGSLDEALALESAIGREHLRSADVAEGLAAFAERRRPNFPSTPGDSAAERSVR